MLRGQLAGRLRGRRDWVGISAPGHYEHLPVRPRLLDTPIPSRCPPPLSVEKLKSACTPPQSTKRPEQAADGQETLMHTPELFTDTATASRGKEPAVQ